MKREKKTNSRRSQKDAKKYLEAHVHKRPRSLPRVGFSWRLEVVDWEQDGKTPNEGETECDSLEPEPEIGTRCRHLQRAVAVLVLVFGIGIGIVFVLIFVFDSRVLFATVVPVVVLILVGHLRAIIV